MKYLALILLMAPVLVKANTIEITYFLKSMHLAKKNYAGESFNTEHKFIGAEYRLGNNGIAASTFINSFYVRSYMVDYARYWRPYKNNIEASFRVGVATGYTKPDECLSNEKSVKICPVVSFGVAYTGSDYFIPKISIIPKAATFSLSFRF